MVRWNAGAEHVKTQRQTLRPAGKEGIGGTFAGFRQERRKTFRLVLISPEFSPKIKILRLCC
jgi:hypothetical protein